MSYVFKLDAALHIDSLEERLAVIGKQYKKTARLAEEAKKDLKVLTCITDLMHATGALPNGSTKILDQADKLQATLGSLVELERKMSYIQDHISLIRRTIDDSLVNREVQNEPSDN